VNEKKSNTGREDWPDSALYVVKRQQQKIRNLRGAIKGYERYVNRTQLMLRAKDCSQNADRSIQNYWYAKWFTSHKQASRFRKLFVLALIVVFVEACVIIGLI